MSLSPVVSLHKNALHDPLMNAHHLVNNDGKAVLRTLQGTGQPYYRLSASEHTGELLGFLNTIGALQRKRTWQAWPGVLRLQILSLLFGGIYPPLARRKPFSFTNLIHASIRATSTLVLTSVAVELVAIQAGLLGAGLALRLFLFALTVFLASLFVHESVHAILIHRAGKPTNIIQRGLRLGLLHSKLPAWQELQSALAGPFAGVALCLAVALICIPLHERVLCLCASVLASFHVLSLLPWYGDGASLLSAVREMRHDTR